MYYYHQSIMQFLDFIGFFLAAIAISLVAIIMYYALRAFFFFIDYMMAKIASKFPKLHSITIFYLNRHTNQNFAKIISNRLFTMIARFDWKDMKLVFELFHSDPSLISTMSPYGQNLIREAYESSFSHQKMIAFANFYEKSIGKLIEMMKIGKKLNERELDRIVFEHSPEERKYLEEHFPNNHPVIQKIINESQIQLNSDFKILK